MFRLTGTVPAPTAPPDDAEAAHAHAEGRAVRGLLVAFAIRAAMVNDLAHAVEKTVFFKSCKTVDAAHET